MISPAGPSSSPSFLDKIKSGAKFLKEAFYDQTEGKISLLGIATIVGSVLTATGLGTIPGIIILSLTAAAATAWGVSALKANKVAMEMFRRGSSSSTSSTETPRSASPNSSAAKRAPEFDAQQREKLNTIFIRARKRTGVLSGRESEYQIEINGKTYKTDCNTIPTHHTGNRGESYGFNLELRADDGSNITISAKKNRKTENFYDFKIKT